MKNNNFSALILTIPWQTAKTGNMVLRFFAGI